jgi:dTDP-3-amino-3,4,6-trideoxy-alpha-D-glucose transaminase
MNHAAAGRVVFNALRPGEDAEAVAAAISRVVASGWYILGPEVEAFEAEFAVACGASHAVALVTAPTPSP